MTLAIQAEGLVKRFGQTLAVDGVDLAVQPGTVLGLLGPNGAGKTTVVRMLATLLRPDAGYARVGGADIVRQAERVRELIGLTGQYAAVDEDLTGFENLLLIGRLLEVPRAEAKRRSGELLERFGLADAAGRSVKTYSGGMRRRLDLAASLVTEPSVIFLDEPTTGLDLPGRLVLWRIITELSDSGVTVFLTTQYLEEADQLADRIAVIDGGRVVAEGTPGELKRRAAAQRLELRLAGAGAFEQVALAAGDRVIHADRGGLIIGVATDGTAAQVRALLDELDPGRRAVAAFSVRSATLEDVFLALTGHAGQEARIGHPSGGPAHQAAHEKETSGV